MPGWVWDVIAEQWEEGFRRLEQFAGRTGHSRVLQDFKTDDGYPLGRWVAVQRRQKSMTSERKARLEALPSWTWNTLEDAWEVGFGYLKEFSDREGHSRVPRKFKVADGYGLSQWVWNQRSRKDSMTPARVARLDALPGWVWDAIEEQWDEGFRHLAEFVGRTGHGRVPSNFKEVDGYHLGKWVGRQRGRVESLTKERKAQLDAIPGWVWSMKSSKNSDVHL